LHTESEIEQEKEDILSEDNSTQGEEVEAVRQGRHTKILHGWKLCFSTMPQKSQG
jgi:hypothetical protein